MICMENCTQGLFANSTCVSRYDLQQLSLIFAKPPFHLSIQYSVMVISLCGRPAGGSK